VNTGEELLIACADAPGGVLIDVSGSHAIAVKYLTRKFAAAARRDHLKHKVVSQGATINGDYAVTLRIWGITAIQAAAAISRAIPVGEWQTIDLRGL
jgi:UDP-N-acetylmuramyl pentapeptide phosphotransferase/UDP-N-acetylglucosamine-1-phosphate transferase